MNGLMVVDDEEGVRRALKKVLERDGYRIVLAENGEEALSIIRSDGRDIETVISDYRMPGMDGLETLIEIGRLNAEITRIMLTGYATMASAIEAVNEGIDGFLTKPFENDELRAKVREYNIKKRLKQFVSEQVFTELQRSGTALLPKRLNVSVLFTDIRGSRACPKGSTPPNSLISSIATTSRLSTTSFSATTGRWTSISGTASWGSSGRLSAVGMMPAGRCRPRWPSVRRSPESMKRSRTRSGESPSGSESRPVM